MTVNRPPSSLSSPTSDTSFLSSPDSLNLSQMSASDHSGIRFMKLPNRHKDFYLDDGNVVFLVDNTYFKVHRFFFQRDSQFFRDTFSRVLSQAGAYTGDELITFTDITSLDFERFLGILYPRDFSKPTATTVDEWTSILDLSIGWGFESIRLLAVEQLTRMASPVDKIVLGRKYHVAEWLRDAYRVVCERAHSLTQEEGLRLGVQEIINISHARQVVREKATLAAPSRLESVIEETFGLGVPSVIEPIPRIPEECKEAKESGKILSWDEDASEFVPPLAFENAKDSWEPTPKGKKKESGKILSWDEDASEFVPPLAFENAKDSWETTPKGKKKGKNRGCKADGSVPAGW